MHKSWRNVTSGKWKTRVNTGLPTSHPRTNSKPTTHAGLRCRTESRPPRGRPYRLSEVPTRKIRRREGACKHLRKSKPCLHGQVSQTGAGTRGKCVRNIPTFLGRGPGRGGLLSQGFKLGNVCHTPGSWRLFLFSDAGSNSKYCTTQCFQEGLTSW